jgi:integrase
MIISKPLAGDQRNAEESAHDLRTNDDEKLKIIAKTIGIKKKVTTHTGRHTFAITICANRGIRCETASELMSITVKTCVENYYKVTGYKINAETARAWERLT